MTTMQATVTQTRVAKRERCPDHGTFMPCTLKDCAHGRKAKRPNPNLPLVSAFGEKSSGAGERDCFLGYALPDPIMRHFNCTRRGHDWSGWLSFPFTEASRPVLPYNGRVHFRQLRRTGYRRRCLVCGKWDEVRP